MADNLAQDAKTGQTAFFSSLGRPEWHRKGQSVLGEQTSESAIILSHLDYEVAKLQSNLTMPCGTDEDGNTKYITKPVPGTFATYRTDTHTPFKSAVGKNYTLLQNKEAFEFFDAIVGKGEAIYTTAGALYSGEQIFITAKLPSYIKVGNNDIIENYLFLTNVHDGTGSIVAAFTPTRIVCWNTLMQALSNCSNKIRIRHSKDVQQKLKDAHKIMGMSNMLTKELDVIFNKFAKTPVSDEKLKEYVTKVIYPESLLPREQVIDSEEKFKLSTRKLNIINNILAYAATHESQLIETAAGTLFGAYNSISGYIQNVKKFRDADDKLMTIIDDKGSYAQTAFDLALTMI